MSILVFGESLVDIFGDGRVVLGGAPFNTARAAARLGAPTVLATTLSTDLFGDRVLDALRADNIDIRYMSRSALPPAKVYVRGEPPTYEFNLDNTASLEFPRTEPTGSLVYYGSVAALREPFAAPLAQFLEKSPALHFFDPNIRVGAFSQTFPIVERVNKLAEFADVIRLSEEDLSHLRSDAVATWLTGRTRVVIVTRGGRPATVHLADGAVFHVPVVATPTFVDSVGAGDTVNGAVLSFIHHHGSVPTRKEVWKPALHTAFTAAALTCSRIGADPPTQVEVMQFMQSCESSESAAP